ncbi:membrane bound O-acyl transferase family-domain-containing protein [Neohortaea acidophila]|uniref:Membrane bound O-acyl transferase family-domain-containing protein n=1 Tax=Neohortaea acidophila TaxID=245834 RepID=A0A6A6PY77_9PEZI|nr:membrane bound O-acyl transferase family-domain-containing protein [Neohortaea acidophila]KAF2484726.1 membrane bound O-acyl transferase family-domain-containing protein [Neohortaea acidophila]
MLPPGLQSSREVTLYHDKLYYNLIDSGQAVPFVYPYAGLAAFLVLAYLLIDHRQSPTLAWLRFPAFGLLLGFQAWCVLYMRAKHPAAALGVGLLSAWGVLWVAAIMVVNDCQTDWVRLERGKATETNGVQKGGGLNDTMERSSNSTETHPKATAEGRELPSQIEWQSYPASFRDRIDWVADVFCNFRGVGWSWQTSGIPPPPQPIESTAAHTRLPEDGAITTSRTGIRRFNNKHALLKTTALKLLGGYFALDLIVTLMHRDPYFWGYAAPPYPPAPTYLPILVQTSPILTKSYRLTLGLMGLYTALSQAFALGPLFFCAVLGPARIGLRGESWMNPADMFGSYACVFDQGLAGWWGGWWHQTFRFGFETVGHRVLSALGIERKSKTGRTVALFVAFFLSGCVHAAGSYTQLGETRPLLGPMRFFLLQAVGILVQVWLTEYLHRMPGVRSSPRWVRRLANFVYVHVFLFWTGPLLLDDFTNGGCFLYEPVAFSPLRALGFGAKDDGWFCWWNGILFWRNGKHWSDTGIAA